MSVPEDGRQISQNTPSSIEEMLRYHDEHVSKICALGAKLLGKPGQGAYSLSQQGEEEMNIAQETTQKDSTQTVVWKGQEVSSAKLLVELFNRAAPQGIGILQAYASREITQDWGEERAQEVLNGRGCFDFDYLFGRPIKVGIYHQDEGNELRESSERLFDRDAGEGQFDEAFKAALA